MKSNVIQAFPGAGEAHPWVSGEMNEDKREVTFSFLSGDEIKRSWGIEKMHVSSESVDFSRVKGSACQLLFNHDPNMVIGKIEKAGVQEDGRAYCTARFSRSELGERVFQDVKDGIITSVSPRYVIHDYAVDERGDDPVLEIKKSSILEISVVSIPADPSVGVGRSMFLEGGVMAEEKVQQGASVDVQSLASDTLAKERGRIAEIHQLARDFDAVGSAAEFVEQGKTPTDFKNFLLEKMKNKPMTPVDASLGLTPKESRSFSFHKAIIGAITGKREGFEFEVMQETAKKLGRLDDFYNSSNSRMFIPSDVLTTGKRDSGQMMTTKAGEGKEWVQETGIDGDSFIGMIHDQLFASDIGLKVYTGLTGNVPFNKQTGSNKAVWFDEGAKIPRSNLSTDRITLRPKQLGTNTSYSKKLLVSTGISLESMIRSDLSHMMSRAIDSAILFGKGSDNPGGQAPWGIVPRLEAAGRGLIDLGGGSEALNYKHLLDLEAEAKRPAGSANSTAYITDRFVRAYLKSRPEIENVGGAIWKNDEINSTRAIVTDVFEDADNQQSAKDLLHYVVYGAFSQMILGWYQGIELHVDTVTLLDENSVRIVGVAMLDIECANIEAFAAIKGIRLDKPKGKGRGKDAAE